MKVFVIGCGPAGVMAAYAALQEGCEVTVWSPPGVGKSTIHGAQYIHHPPDGLPEEIEPFEVRYRKFGTEQGYRRKIYADAVPQQGTSWDRFRPMEWAWPMTQVYDYLWDLVAEECTMYECIVDESIVLHMVDNADYVFNTAPLRAIKPDGQYRFEEVYIVDDRSEGVPENEIWYFGDERAAYRSSNIRGHKSIEYPRITSVPFYWRRHHATKVVKPLDCKVELPGVCRLGRYGKWQKGVLVNDAYDEARRILQWRLSWMATLPA